MTGTPSIKVLGHVPIACQTSLESTIIVVCTIGVKSDPSTRTNQ